MPTNSTSYSSNANYVSNNNLPSNSADDTSAQHVQSRTNVRLRFQLFLLLHYIQTFNCVSTPFDCARLCVRDVRRTHFTHVALATTAVAAVKSANSLGGDWESPVPSTLLYVCGSKKSKKGPSVISWPSILLILIFSLFILYSVRCNTV